MASRDIARCRVVHEALHHTRIDSRARRTGRKGAPQIVKMPVNAYSSPDTFTRDLAPQN